MIKEPSRIAIRNHGDHRGILNSLELPFPIKRVYYIKDARDVTRGDHAHKTLNQIFLSISGSFMLSLQTPEKSFKFELSDHNSPVVVPAGYWRVLSDFSPDSVVMVLASEHFDEDDYIRDYDHYLTWYNSHNSF